MRYISTRGAAPALDFEGVLLAGLASDSGLYVPESWPAFDAAVQRGWRDLDYPSLGARVMAPFVAGALDPDEFAAMIAETCARFDHPDVAPLVDLGDGVHLMELFHGPTLAFKDYALQLVGRLFDHVLAKRGQRITIVGATSGDTGSAAIAACRDRAMLDIFMLHPKGRVSDVQRRQMTTVDAPNVYNIAVDGNFDDCQDLVKAMFADERLRSDLRLSAVNSINWARVLAQTVYYFWAGLKLGAPDNRVSFAVPTGNFGNVYAGYVAKQAGLPVDQLIVGSNRNDILTRFLDSARMEIRSVEPSLSPSMDIQVSSNFERLLFDLYGRDGAAVAKIMQDFRKTGLMVVEPDRWQAALDLFAGARFDDEETLAVIREVHAATGMLIDPHTAIGIAAGRARRRDRSVPLVALATAHPAKFPDAVEKATGLVPPQPPALAALAGKPEKCAELPNDVAAVSDYVRSHAAAGVAA